MTATVLEEIHSEFAGMKRLSTSLLDLESSY